MLCVDYSFLSAPIWCQAIHVFDSANLSSTKQFVFPLTYIMLNWGQEHLFLLPWYLKCAGQSEIKLALTDAGKVETKLFYV